MNKQHGGRITGGALTLHQLHSVGACVSYVWQSLPDITEQLLVGHQSGNQWTHSYQAASAQLATHKPRLHAIGGPSKRQPMNSLVSSCLGSTWLSYKPPKVSRWCIRISIDIKTIDGSRWHGRPVGVMVSYLRFLMNSRKYTD